MDGQASEKESFEILNEEDKKMMKPIGYLQNPINLRMKDLVHNKIRQKDNEGNTSTRYELLNSADHAENYKLGSLLL